jgi:CRISPR-associated endonuclease/helicase Cas3
MKRKIKKIDLMICDFSHNIPLLRDDWVYYINLRKIIIFYLRAAFVLVPDNPKCFWMVFGCIIRIYSWLMFYFGVQTGKNSMGRGVGIKKMFKRSILVFSVIKLRINDVFLFWAKSEPYHPLICHSIDVGVMVETILGHPAFSYVRKTLESCFSKFSGSLIRLMGLYAALHDLGKLSDKFQGKSESMVEFLLENGINVSVSTESFRHEILSAELFASLNLNGGNLIPAVPNDLFSTFRWMVRSHHSKDEDQAGERAVDSQRWKECRGYFVDVLRDLFLSGVDSSEFSGVEVVNCGALCVVLLGSLVLSDWLVSNHDVYDYSGLFESCEGQSLDVYMSSSRGLCESVLNRLGFGGSVEFPCSLDYESLFRDGKFRCLRPVQESIMRDVGVLRGPGITLMEAPMGEGKTEAALFEAVRYIKELGLNGFYFALPTAATSNQMYGRIAKVLDGLESTFPPHLRLIHSTSWLLDDPADGVDGELDGGSESELSVLRSWFHPSRRGILAPYCVGTVDQVMKAVMVARFSILRLFGLMNKVLIIDELHSYDTYMMASIEQLIKWCAVLRIPVIMLSATLPFSRREQMMRLYIKYSSADRIPPSASKFDLSVMNPKAYPLITHFDSADSEFKEICCGMASLRVEYRLNRIEGLMDDFDGIARLAIERADVDKGQCVCVLLNTVERAQRCYLALINILGEKRRGEYTLKLFHARFLQEDRNRVESEVLEMFDKRSLEPGLEHLRPKKAILVATQVVEQSLDVDFDELITDIAPIDLLIQRFGRVHRHPRPLRVNPNDAVCNILMPDSSTIDFGVLTAVYPEYVLLTTYLYLRDHDVISLPDTIRDAIEFVYREFSESNFTMINDVLLDRLRVCSDEFTEKKGVLRGAVKPYLISEPSYLSNNLSAKPQTKREDEDDEFGTPELSFAYVKTRYGEYTQRCCFIDMSDPRESALIANEPPNRDKLRALYLKTVNIPVKWFKNLHPVSGFESYEIPKWMPGVYLFKMKKDSQNHAVYCLESGTKQTVIKRTELGIVKE